jgi:hypothetical protein
MQSLGDLGANEPCGALHRRVIDRSCRPTFDLLVALTTGAGSENVAKRRTQQNPEHSDPHSLDLRQFTGDTSGQTTKAQVDDLGLCSPDWTRTSNRPINSCARECSRQVACYLQLLRPNGFDFGGSAHLTRVDASVPKSGCH